MIRYIGNGELWSAERAAEVSTRILQHWRDHGFGWRVAVSKSSGEEIGFAALNYAGEGRHGLDPDEFEIGWWFDPEVWGQGLAGEAAHAICDEAFTRLGAPSLVARIGPENAASQRLALRLGMSFEFDTTGRFGEPLRVYRLMRPA